MKWESGEESGSGGDGEGVAFVKELFVHRELLYQNTATSCVFGIHRKGSGKGEGEDKREGSHFLFLFFFFYNPYLFQSP